MLTPLSSTDLLRACQILFSPEKPFSVSFVESLDPTMLKTAFRKKALETHPDRAKALGIHEREQTRRFREVKRAYDVLMPLADKSAPIPDADRVRAHPEPGPGPRTEQKPPRRPAQARKSSFYTGIVPGHSLKLGQYLYYSGIITWRHLIDAISWQRRIKPRYGQIAQDWNILDHYQILQILQNRDGGERFGEFARRCGLISDFQHLAILGKQKKHHRLFGEYFLDHGILTQRQLDILLKRLEKHNRHHNGHSF